MPKLHTGSELLHKQRLEKLTRFTMIEYAILVDSYRCKLYTFTYLNLLWESRLQGIEMICTCTLKFKNVILTIDLGFIVEFV